MVFSPYPDFVLIYNSHDLSLPQRLVIPSDYRKYYPTPLPQTAVLRKPEGNFWTVKWKISEEETISFEDGWSKFVKDNGPIDGDFLLFTYDGYRSFWVRIYRNGLVVEPKTTIKVQEISDDDDETGGDDDETVGDDDVGDDDGDEDYDMEKEEDSNQNTITSLSLGTSDEDDADTTIGEVNIGHSSLKRGGSNSQRKRAEFVGDPEMYIDDPRNPCFIATSSCARGLLVIAMQVIKDYSLKFDGTVNLIDRYGVVEGRVGGWTDRVVVYKWDEIYKRNDAKPEDLIICEILREGNVVKSIKPHFVKASYR